MSIPKSDSYTSSRYRQFSVSSPDIMHAENKALNDDHFKPNYDHLTSLNEINQAKFSPSLPFKFGGNKFGKFKLPQMFNSENVLPANDLKDNWISKYFKPSFILNYINPKYPTKDCKDDDFEILFNEIEINEQVGCGNQGIVYSGMYRGNRVAVKRVKDRDETEIKHLKRLQHPNIIKFIGVTIGEPCYIVMEYCSKGQLYDALKYSDNVTRELVVDWLKQIIKGMAYLHSKKVIHRDLYEFASKSDSKYYKSLNILINQDNKLKICDFGNSKSSNELSAKMSFAGTVAWMAVEMVKGGKYSEKVDIWSFGVVFWELLFCERPYKGFEQHSILMGVGKNLLTLPIPSTCPPRYRTLMQQCWNVEPNKRPDFNQIQADLKVANKEFLSSFTDKNFIEIKHKWKEDIDQNLSQIKNLLSSSDDENPMLFRKIDDKGVQDIKNELEEKLQDVNKLLKNLKQREKQLRKIEKEYEIKYVGHKSSSNSLINSLSRRLIHSTSSNNKSSSLRLSKFVRNRSRRSYRLHYAQKQCNRTATKDAEIQTNFIDLDVDDESMNNLNLNNHQYKVIDSGYVTSCLSTPTIKHRFMSINGNKNNNSSLVQNTIKSSGSENEDNHFKSSVVRNNKKCVDTGFRLHHNNHTAGDMTVDDPISVQKSNISNELPSGYLEASFENKLMLKKGPNNFCEYRGNGKFSSTAEESLEESDEETRDISVDSLNNNKYSEIYRPSSESLSSANSLSWENGQHELTSVDTATNCTKSIDFSTTFRPLNGLKLDTCKRMATINDESDDSSLTINNSYVVIPSSKSNQNYIVLQSPTKDQLPKKSVRDSLLLYKNKSFKKDEIFM